MERGKFILELLHQAHQLEPNQRSEFLEAKCAGDAELRRQVEVRLTLDSSAVFDALRPYPPMERESLNDTIGTQLGSYRILQKIGQGGMGVVVLAEHPYQGRVAVKILKKGMDTEQFVHRFQMERQILTRLDHPNIAQILDGGSTADGRPYFVMEYVQGIPLHRYCHRHCPNIKEILRLFMQVCEAVQSAHQKLVIHRDIKPSNILVTAAGQPKLLDFGIATLLEKKPFETETGLRPMTVEYASPEQVCGQTMTTASDVYSLAVVLFQLLSGFRPYEEQMVQKKGLAWAIVNQPAPQPGPFLLEHYTEGLMASRFANIGECRTWVKGLNGDLTTILGKALKKHPDQRYTTPLELKNELEAFICGRPIAARKSTFFYRIGKGIKRNPLVTTGSALLMLMVLAFMVTLIGAKNRLILERDRAETAKVAAQKSQSEALRQRKMTEQVSEFMIGIFKNSDPYQQSGEPETTRDLMNQAIQDIRRRPIADNAIKASWLSVLGKVHGNLQWHQEALPLLEDACALYRQEYGERHPATVESQTLLAKAKVELGRYQEAEASFNRNLTIARENPTWEPKITADIYAELGNLALKKGQYDRAEEYLVAACKGYAMEPESGREQYATTQASLAVIYKYQNKLERAETLARQSLHQQKLFLGERHPETAISLNNLAMILIAQGQYTQAEALFLQAQGIIEENFDRNHIAFSYSLNNLAGLYKLSGRNQESLVLYEKILPIWEEKLGENHPTTAYGIHNTAMVLLETGEYSKAEPLFRRAMKIRAGLGSQNNPYYASSLKGLAITLGRLNDHDQALDLLGNVLEIERTVLVEKSHRYLATLNIISGMFTQLTQFDEAQIYLNSALQGWQKIQEHPFKRDALFQAVKLARARNRPEDEAQACAELLSFHRLDPPAQLERLFLLDDCDCLLSALSSSK